MKTFFLSVFIFIVSSSAFSQWNVQYTSNPSQTVMALRFYDVNTGYHSGVLYNGSFMNIYKTTNGGLNYTAQYSGYTAQRFMSIYIIHPDTVFISGNYGKILRTVNGGTNWIPYVYSDTTVQFWGLWFVNSLTGYASGSSGKILKTTNKGDNWTTLATPTQTALDGIYFLNENTGYVGGANVFLKTTDAGNSWINKNGSFISAFETATSLYFSDANNGIYCTNAGRIVTTSNGGENWSLVYSMSGGIWGISFPNPQTGYACTSSGTVLKTTNGGLNWGVQNTPLTENLYEIHFLTEQTGYIASWSGKILKTTNGGLTYIAGSSNEIPAEYKLEQNYPNPFNSESKIKFGLPVFPLNKGGQRGLFTILKIFNIQGKEVATLVNEFLEPGTYEVSWTAENFPSGVYFYKLISDSFTSTKKLILIK